MKIPTWSLLPAATLMFLSQPRAGAEDKYPDGDIVLSLVRRSQAMQDLRSLQGRLRNSNTGASYPMELTMSNNVVRFLLRNPNEIINLDLNDNGTKLSRVVSGGKVDMPVSLYGQRLRGTDINYEDLSMRFLYWPHAKVIGDDSMSYQKCWIVRVTNPDGRGPYGTVDICVAQKSGAMMKMEAYDAKGRKLKQFLVRKGQKFKDSYILKQMRVESFDPNTKEVTGTTYMEIDDPTP